MLVVFTGTIKMKVESLKVMRQDFEEWQMANSKNPEIRIGYNDYKRMLELVRECATILNHSTPMIEDNDLLLVPLVDPNPDHTLKFDCTQLSNQAFEELEESLGLGN